MELSNKNILIIGANGGLALETIKALIRQGATKITLGCRTLEKAQQTKDLLLSAAKESQKIKLLPIGGFDMLDKNSIEKTIANLPRTKYDVIFLAAGGIIIDTEYPIIEIQGTKIEKTSFQNLFGAHIVLNNLIEQKLIADKARVVYAGGEGARGIPGMIQKPTFNSILEFREYLQGSSKATYNPMNAIGVSKLLGAIWTIKISEIKNRNFDILWFSPGLTYGTNGLSKMTPIKRWAMEKIGFGLMRLIGKAQSPADGADKFVKALDGAIGTNGDVLGAPEKQTLGKITDQKPMNSAITDRELQTELWKFLEDTTGSFSLS